MDIKILTSAAKEIEHHYICRATGGVHNGTISFEKCRDVLLSEYHQSSDTNFKGLFPELITDYQSLDAFWQFIKNEYATYAERRTFIMEKFQPLKKHLESKKYAMTSQIVTATIEISNDYINDAIKKANLRIQNNDYDGAITTARTLIEEMESEIYEKRTGHKPGHKGDLIKLYNMLTPLINLSISKDLNETLKPILSGLYSINNGIANMRNSVGDAHAKRFKAEAHHARLAVNCALTFCQFLCDTYLYQKRQG